MVLMKVGDFDPHYKDTFGGYDIKGLSVYADVDDNKIGSVHDLLVDENGRFRYLVVDLGFWSFGTKILLPVGRSRVDANRKRVYTLGLTKEQAKQLPEFTEDLRIDTAYEALVHSVYRPTQSAQPTHQSAASASNGQPGTAYSQQNSYPQAASHSSVQGQPLREHTDYQTTPPPQTGYHQQATGYPHPTSMPEQTVAGNAQHYDRQHNIHPGSAGYAASSTAPNSDNAGYDYRQDPELYEMNSQNHGLLQQYEERLMQHAQRTRGLR